MSLTSWFLVSSGGTRHRLPREMIFVGREDCELMLQSRSVDKQHAVINYDASADEHLVKDLGSLNGTFVNDVRIPEQTYITLKLEDKLRFGYDTNLFTVVRGEMRVPEEALKHEKFTIQLQLSQKSSEPESSKSACAKSVDSKVADPPPEAQHKATEALKAEEKALDTSAMPRGTPLYGQPSWWGDDEVDEKRAFKSNGKPEEKNHETGTSGCSLDAKQVEEQSAAANEEVLFPLCREPSYFEIPTKEFQQPSQITESTIHEIPTKDTASSHTTGAGHASFTIEFDDSAPGKVTIRDHVTKFTSEQRHKSRKSSLGTQDLPGIQTGMMAPENKVADWLAQNNPPQMVWERTEDDSKSIKSDVPVYLKRLKGNKHDDGTQSDSENAGAHRRCSKRATLEEHLRRHHSEQKKLQKALAADKHQDPAVVFGVDDSQDYNRPVINEKQKDLIKDWALGSAAVMMEERKPLGTPGFHNTEEGTAASGSKRWVSQWASLAANHTRHDPEERTVELSVPVPLENDADFSESGISVRSSGSAASLAGHGERRRRTLPQLPNEEKALESSRAKALTPRSEIGEKQDTELQEKEAPSQVYQKDRQDADRALGKVSRAVNGETLRTGGDHKALLHLGLSSPGKERHEADKEASLVKQTLAKIQHPEPAEQAQWAPTKLSSKNASGPVERSREESLRQDSQPHEKIPGHCASKGERAMPSEGKRRKADELLKGHPPKGGDKKDSSKPLVRQGSFTIEKPSPNVPIELIPHINKQTSATPPPLALASASRLRDRSDSVDADSSLDTTLPRPRPTRTSLLRRARLGEASDSELADADKASVASEVSTTSSTSKPPTGRRNISRIDLLAQPRRTRLGSLSARSDSEATISRGSASSRTAEAIIRSGARLVPSDKFSPRIRANSISRLSDSKVKSMTSTHGSPSALKTTRLQSSGSAMPTSSSFKHRIKEQEDYIRDWTAHREEIARISQDLALIAREINDVAGEIDSVTSSGTAPSTTVSTAATTPGSAIDTREEVGEPHGEMHKLVDRVFDESLNFRKIPPLVNSKTPEGNNCRANDSRPQPPEPPDHLTITRRRTWSRDEVMGDNLLLSSVFQFSKKIRQSIDKTAGKIRILFKDKDRNWDEIESKLRAESEVPIVKTSSMEISSILQELKRVEKQLQAINAMIDPDGTLEALNNMGFPNALLPSPPKQKSSPVNNHSSPGQTPSLCPADARVLHPAAISSSAEFENTESEADFSIHFNRFNPDGEEEEVPVPE
uniref:Centrosomal protein of 170 kDa n=1 Tax=Myotis myotis TaxID=51298 RepID=A0A7J7RU31_MYOMY|nr:centrosomal protein 170 [Myotis myotis]